MLGALALVLAALTPAGSPAGAQVDVTNDIGAVREVLQHIPSAFRTTCTILDKETVLTDLADRIEANLACVPSGADGVYYTRLDSQSDLDSAFQEYLPSTYTRVDQKTGCAESGTYSQGGKTAGRFFCGPLTSGDKTVAAYVWTNDANRLLISAVRYDQNYEALQSFYNHDAGPNIKASSLGFPLRDTAAQQHDLARALIAQVPEQSRQFCSTLDLTDLAGLGGVAPYRAWVRAAVLCRPGSGAATVWYYRIGSGDSLDQIFRDLGSNGIEAHTNIACPTSAPYARNKHAVGDYACYYTGDKGQSVSVLWTYRPKLILGSAFRSDTRSDLLLTFWRTRGGPIG
jgi:hypothetical protein